MKFVRTSYLSLFTNSLSIIVMSSWVLFLEFFQKAFFFRFIFLHAILFTRVGRPGLQFQEFRTLVFVSFIVWGYLHWRAYVPWRSFWAHWGLIFAVKSIHFTTSCWRDDGQIDWEMLRLGVILCHRVPCPIEYGRSVLLSGSSDKQLNARSTSPHLTLLASSSV